MRRRKRPNVALKSAEFVTKRTRLQMAHDPVKLHLQFMLDANHFISLRTYQPGKCSLKFPSRGLTTTIRMEHHRYIEAGAAR